MELKVTMRDANGDKIMREVKPSITCMPHSYEQFMTFSIGDIRFIDSFKFMASGLEKLTQNLYDKEDKYKNFHCMKKEYPKHYKLLCQKGHFPYEWFNDISKLNYKGLPPINEFYSKLKQETLNDEQHAHATTVYNELKCQKFEDYLLAYLKTDVLLLADVFESFRKHA